MKGMEIIDEIIKNLTHKLIKNINNVYIFPLK